MDRPMGPRSLPPPSGDKRGQAYESIFGRPSASHHQTPQPPQFHPQQNYYYHQHQPIPQDRRASYAPSFQNGQYPYSNAYPHPHHPQQQYPNPTGYPPRYMASPYSGNSLAPPSMMSRARSINSNPYAQGIIAPQPEEPPDPALEALTQRGLTPAQAYQAQVYMNSPGSNGNASLGQLQEQANRNSDIPRLGITTGGEEGKFGEFGENNSSDDSSELPWAKRDSPANSRTGTPASPPPNRFSSVSGAHPLHVDTAAAQSVRSSLVSTSPSSFTLADEASTNGARRSSESSHTLPRLMSTRRDRTVQDRSMSMSAATGSLRLSKPPSSPFIEPGSSPGGSIRGPRSSNGHHKHHRSKPPVISIALLSHVAQAFRDRIQLGDKVKDSLTYKDAFDGREAVDKLAYIIKTTDRNLALLLGRALDAQKFFHDVTYDHRLRDTSTELYQFRTKLPSPFVSGDLPAPPEEDEKEEEDKERGDSASPAPSMQKEGTPVTSSSDEVELPSGVFTLLTDCYSPTCSRDQLCYSIACPRRLEQQARLNMKPQPGLSKQISKESLNDAVDDGTLWIHSVPQEIVNSVSDKEKKRQEAINEVIYTEKDFVRDMEYLRDIWIKRLQESDVIPPERRTTFLEQVFWNVYDIIAVNTKLRDALLKRQKQYAVVEKIGDIYMDAVPHFGPFVSYGAHQLYGKYEFEKEKNSNPAFSAFVETTERLPESRKLELNAYLTKPTTRLARYPLLLEAVIKHTPDDNPDKTVLPQVVTMIREFLARVNTESGRTENRFNLIQLDQQLMFKQGEEVDLRLSEEGREMIYKGPLNKRDGEIHVYLFDHAVLFTKLVKTKQHEQYKVYRRPIPLELLYINCVDDLTNGNGSGSTVRVRQRQGLVKKTSFSRESRNSPVAPVVNVRPEAKGTFWINFIHLGRKHYTLTLWANSQMAMRKWTESIWKQQQALRDRSMLFDTVPLSEGFFTAHNKVNCAAPFHAGRKVVYGTDDGIYISDLREVDKDPVKVLALLDVVQVDVLEDYQLLIVLSGKSLFLTLPERQVITFPLDALDSMDPMAGLKRAKRISSHTSFFKAGQCLGRMLVCIVKSSQLSSTFKALEPIDQNIRGRSKPTFRKLLQGGNDTLKPFREFYIPVESTSIHYLKTKMCVGCSRGFEIVDLETLDTQGLLDPNDESLEFVRKRDNLRPIAIYRIHNEFLLCYDGWCTFSVIELSSVAYAALEFAFYVNKTGRRSRKEFMVHWEGNPTGFALHEPYVLAFEPSFVEIRHIETGLMSQVIQGSNLRLLFADNPPSMTNGNNMSPVVGPGGYYGPPGYQQPGYAGYNGYGPPPPQMPGYPNMMYSQQQQQQFGRPYTRDEILIVSDDRVMALRTTGGHRMIPDNASMHSIPR
ncbi:RHO1 GDP-GTP exchange protein 2 [Marasmius crinis-equi]|uniref:RHO1 GDP-GTP exchange protein 2 n=1 Tax=Marasmius crinis-equi TaxID=585013 RepID=A0ABR3F2X0_9AGAR